ncbi:MAG: hypothetical protein AB2556_22440 [Candidatus Thiodiazotropha sp.]
MTTYARMASSSRETSAKAMQNADAPTILANVCTWVCTTRAGYTVRTKMYNKVVLNFAGEVHERMGSHLADYADCPKEYLCWTFLHPDVQAHSCTRIEVSLYACRGRDLSANTAREVMEEALAAEQPLIIAQLPSRLWTNLATCLDAASC